MPAFVLVSQCTCDRHENSCAGYAVTVCDGSSRNRRATLSASSGFLHLASTNVT